ncbi:glycosyltransferase [Roseomonas populi]|uniref:Glycosyltransferase n=1 Tax=Roseomonas populi TaxID=3121582 RepID=A0ABT1X6D4_9PROT|nr:glycosyltransferase [Roseomonas pecuniae]MCR0983666.1 glycosyltransferase [Roseomonas pecuniae]
MFQRPQHLLSRAAASYRVVLFEEPLFPQDQAGLPRLDLREMAPGVQVATPLLPPDWDEGRRDAALRELLDDLLAGQAGGPVAVAWYYTPMMLSFSGHLQPAVTVYDCMDELSAFRGASQGMQLLERRLMQRADLVFTGGRSLYEAKRGLHPSVHLFASGVNADHFAPARQPQEDPADQRDLPHPRLGWFGVVDERMDLDLLRAAAERRPEWSFVMLGPVVKIDPASLPDLPNIHWLGMKGHGSLPGYLANWDAGIMPFALNESTRFISPTKTPEYLAAGVPVVSTPVADVVRDWGEDGLVAIASDAEGFVAAAEATMARPRAEWLPRADVRLARISWDGVWAGMDALIHQAHAARGTDPSPTPATSLTL